MDHPDFNLCARFTPMQAVCSLIDKNQEKKNRFNSLRVFKL